MKRIQKIVSIFLSLTLFAGQLTPVALAYELPTAPSAPTAAPTAPTAPTPPSAPTAAPTAPTAPTAPSAPTAAPTAPTAPTGFPTPEATPSVSNESTSQQTPSDQSDTQPNTQTQQSANQSDGGAVGDTNIGTGDATNTSTLTTDANINSASVSDGCCDSGGIKIANTGNGSGSENTGSASISDSNTTNQTNSASIVNNLSQTSVTGENTSSKNVGNTTITTGDANTTGTLITSVNTNIAGLMVSEFNVADDHVGDIILDFHAGCVSGCGGSTTLANTGNGANSTNTSTLDTDSTNNTFQTNDASVLNTMVLDANSGDNTADKNTGGDSAITTGDANITANLLTFVNNNVSGDVVYGVVNIYGNLLGDIIFPESEFDACCGTSAILANTGNGAGSTNTTNLNVNTSDASTQTNLANIENTLLINAQTGQNETSKNTNGDNSIKTGTANVDAQVVNIANTNLDGGNWWLVLVNEAGKWIGHILGADGNYAGSTGTEFAVNEAGEISITNSGNGAGSTNTATLNQNDTTTTTQTNTAKVVNNVTLDANTGGNSASKNTGGNNTIQTGDANVIANIVNFVNNNIMGGGKLFVTVVNVFGSWTGNFLPPGYQKEEVSIPNNIAIGGSDINVSTPSVTQTNQSSQASQVSFATSMAPSPTLLKKATILTMAAGTFGNTQVLGSTFVPKDNTTTVVAAKQSIQINLAWLILLLPCAIILYAFKRMRKAHIN